MDRFGQVKFISWISFTLKPMASGKINFTDSMNLSSFQDCGLIWMSLPTSREMNLLKSLSKYNKIKESIKWPSTLTFLITPTQLLANCIIEKYTLISAIFLQFTLTNSLKKLDNVPSLLAEATVLEPDIFQVTGLEITLLLGSS